MKLEYAKSSLYSISSGVRGKSSTDYLKVDDAITWGGRFLVPIFQALSTPISQFSWHSHGEKGLIITISDTSIGDLPLILTISDTCKNQPKRLDFDNTMNLSSLIVSLGEKGKNDIWGQREGQDLNKRMWSHNLVTKASPS